MAVRQRLDVLDVMRGLHFNLEHFARGTYPAAQGYATLTVNRLLLFECGGSGSRISWRGRDEILPERGRVVLIPSGVPANVTLDEETRFLSIQFNLDCYFSEDLIGRTGAVRTFLSEDFLTEAIAIYETESALFPGLRIQEMLSRIFQLLKLDLKLELRHEKESTFRESLRIMETCCSARTSVSELAEAENMPRGSFTRSFTRAFGMCPKDYLERALMRRAETLLRLPEMNVKKTAAKLQFSSEFYFSRFFHKHAGISPREFRKQAIW